MFHYQSSPISWCETNFYILYSVCEFFNTLTGFAYILSGYFYKKNLLKIYGNKIKLSNYYNFNEYQKYYYNMYLIHILVGIFTIYFHATLSLISQLLDEFSIFILILLFDFEHMKYLFWKIVFCFVVFFFIRSDFNRFFLFFYGFYRSQHLFLSYFNNKNLKLKNLFLRGIFTLFISIVCWILDIFFCDYLYFHLHWAWHILSAYSIYLLSNYILFNRLNLNFKYKYLFLVDPEI